MAYAAVVSLHRFLRRIAYMAHTQRITIPSKEEGLICQLSQKLNSLQDFLENSSQNSRQEVKSLEIKIRDAVYDAEDVIESRIHNLLQKPKSPLRETLSELSGNHCRELQKIIGEFTVIITEEAVKIGEVGSSQQNLQPSTFLPSLSAPRGLANMVGFDADLLEIKDRLCNEQQSKLKIIPIVGMGGSGKTTLAMNVYNDSFVVYHFYIRAWVTVSQQYSLREVLLCLLNEIVALTGEKRQDSNENLAEYLYKSLKGQRYLIVIDDMWSTKAWDDLRIFLPNDNNGSRIIFTTRLTDVADYADDLSTHHRMRFLNEEESWNLFREKVFGQENCPSELEGIGKKIAKNCKGLPLSIVVIGGLLSKANKTIGYWENVAENLNSIIIENDDPCSKILALSYDHLPHHLKACFLYMGAFPEDYEIPVSKLINLWVAEGFLKFHHVDRLTRDRFAIPEYENFEEVADKCLTDLIDRNLVLVRRRGSNGKIKTCNMHDLLREICVRIGQEEKFLYVKNINSKAISIGNIQQRRLSVHRYVVKDNDASYGFIEDIRETMRLISGARSLLLIGSYPIESEDPCSLKLLRVLDIVETKLFWSPREILNLFNLTYLAMNCEHDFPYSISVLGNLQTLIVYSQKYDLPNIALGIWEMRQIRHVKLARVFLRYSDLESNVLETMVTISAVANFHCTDMVVRRMPNLKKLGIYYTGDEVTVFLSTISLSNLRHFCKLEKLKLCFQSPRDLTIMLGIITFPESLKKITLEGCEFPWKYMSTFSSVPNLEVLKLHHAFLGPEWVPTEGEFLKLKFLQISGTNLVHWRAESDHFPSLEHLHLKNCSKLVEIPSGIGEILTLETIKMDDSSASAVDSAWQILEEQKKNGNDGLQLLVYPCRSEF